jgi:excisionase family DNA binding protein
LAYSVDELAKRWGMSPSKIREECLAGRLRSFTVGRARRIPEAAALEYMARVDVGPAPAERYAGWR